MCNPSLSPWAMLIQYMELMEPEYIFFTLYLHLLCIIWFTHTECKCKGNCKGKKVKRFPFLALLLVLLVLVLYLHVPLHHTCTRSGHWLFLSSSHFLTSKWSTLSLPIPPSISSLMYTMFSYHMWGIQFVFLVLKGTLQTCRKNFHIRMKN